MYEELYHFIYIVLEASAKIFKRKNVNYRGLFIHIIESQLKRNKIQCGRGDCILAPFAIYGPPCQSARLGTVI